MNLPNTPESAEHALLVDATQKLIDLRHSPLWQNELLSRCPPVLWFGNTKSKKPIILTIGANPSRWEYFHENSRAAIERFATHRDESLVKHLENEESRFRVLNHDERLEDILTNESLRSAILGGYDSYFRTGHKPYDKWFGKKDDPYKVECFLRGFGASFYEGRQEAYQAIHIDLFPFATLKNFKDLQGLAEADLFRNNWAQSMIARLIGLIEPKALVVFGKTNFTHYANYVDPSINRFQWKWEDGTSYCFGVSSSYNLPLIGLSANLGNPIRKPKGFTKESLAQFGRDVARSSGFDPSTIRAPIPSPAPTRTYAITPPKAPKDLQKPSASWTRYKNRLNQE